MWKTVLQRAAHEDIIHVTQNRIACWDGNASGGENESNDTERKRVPFLLLLS
jgi:hypothetical protein